MKLAWATLLWAAILSGCQGSQTDRPETATSERKKTTAEKAFDAGQRAKKKAEAIKEEQDRKAKETDDAASQ